MPIDTSMYANQPDPTGTSEQLLTLRESLGATGPRKKAQGMLTLKQLMEQLWGRGRRYPMDERLPDGRQTWEVTDDAN